MNLYPAASVAARRATLLQILAGYTIAGWDVGDAADIVITGAGVSNHIDSVGTYDALQATDSARPIYSNLGPLSYYDGNAANRHLRTALGTSFSGGDLCLISIAKFSATNISRCVLGTGSGSTSRTRIITASAGAFFTGVIRDSVGDDVIVGPASDTGIHMQILLNETGVRRKFWVDGGAGAAGARTTAVFDTHTAMGILANVLGAQQASTAQVYFSAICKPIPTNAVLNALGAAYAARFASLGATWNTLS